MVTSNLYFSIVNSYAPVVGAIHESSLRYHQKVYGKSQLDDLFFLSYHTTGEKPRDAEKIPYIFLSPLEKMQCLQ